jgi:signal transduction histidine kinase
MGLIRQANMQGVPDSAIKLFAEAARQSAAGNFALGSATALCAIGSRHCDMGRYAEAMDFCRKAQVFALQSGDRAQIAFSRNLEGVIHFLQGNYVGASAAYFAALQGLPQVDTHTWKAAINVYTNLANLASRMRQDDKVLQYLNKGEALSRDEKITLGRADMLLAGILINKGNYYERRLMPDSALKYYEEVAHITQRMDPANGKRLRYLVLAEVNMAAVYLQTGRYEQAAEKARHGMMVAQNKYTFITLGAAYTLGEALRQMKQYNEAEQVLKAALKENTRSNTKDRAVYGYATLARVYRQTGRYKEALAVTDSLIALKDTLVNTSRVQEVALAEARYETAAKDAQIARNELLITRQQNKLTTQNLWIGAILGVVLLLGMLLASLYYISRQKQANVIRLLQQQNTIGILKGVVQGEENERVRLARDLHDGIGGMLSATKMRFMALRHENEAMATSVRYAEAIGLLDKMGDEIRKTTHNLMPEVLQRQDITDAIRTYCSDMQAGTTVQVAFQHLGNFNWMPTDLKVNVYRIVQELVKNVLQHAGATHCMVQMMMLEDYLTVSVEDDGAGFDTQNITEGMGLKNLKARILSHEGHYTLRSGKDAGTTVYIEFEVKAIMNNKI